MLALLLLPYSTAPASATGTSTSTTFSGRAIGVMVDTSLVDLKLADTGELPSKGGLIDATVLKVDHKLVQANVLLSVTMGFDKKAQSEVAVADVTLLPGTLYPITADFVRSRSTAVCTGASGLSEIVSLKLAGKEIVISGKPNQKVEVLGVLTLTINEQVNTSTDKTKEIKVIALHLKLVTGEEVIVSSAHSDITCGKLVTKKKDFVTGGGFITVDGKKANFGFVAGFKPGKTTVSGQLNYIDHANDIHVKSSSVTLYSGTGNTRTFSGSATINGQSGFTFSATVTDNGEPGKGVDKFSIKLSDGYQASGTLAGGNIQLHT